MRINLALVFLLFHFQLTYAQHKRELIIKSQYIHFPVTESGELCKVNLTIGGNIFRNFELNLSDEPDFWVYLDVSAYIGKRLTIISDNKKTKDLLLDIYQSDKISYFDDLYKEKHRPQLHFSSKRGWLNDPNGLVYYEGEYHLFYQHNPYGWEWGNMHWGHAVSNDLIHWVQLPIALYPDENGVCFSGGTLIDKNNSSGFGKNAMIALYTSVAKEQTQSLAYSLDNGRSWSRYSENPVIPGRSEQAGSPEVRDPNVFWHEPTSKWVMILFENMGHSIFTSKNLVNWQFESHFETFHECPELFELPIDGDTNKTKWVTYGASGYYTIGSFDGKIFTPEFGQFRYVDGEFYAAQTYENIPSEDGRQIQIGWATIETPDMPFNMMMGFPTELTLRETANGIRLFNEPISEIEILHKNVRKYKNLTWKETNEKLKEHYPDMLHLKMILEPISAGTFNLRIGSDYLGYEWYNNKFNYNEREYSYDRELGRKELTLEIIVDRTSIEVYVDRGAYTIVLPRTLEQQKRGLAFELNPEFKMLVKNLEIYELSSIWN